MRSGLTGDPKVPVAKFDFAALAAAEPEQNILADAWKRAEFFGTSLLTATTGLTFIIEIFAGCCRFTGACAEAGLNVVAPIEKNVGPWCDVSNDFVQAAILFLISKHKIWYVHLATPCTSWSRARTTSSKLPVMSVIWFTCKVLRACKKHGIYWSFENPFGSGLFTFPPIVEAMAISSPASGGAGEPAQVRYECCAWGASYQKPSEMRTNFQPLVALGKRCRDSATRVQRLVRAHCGNMCSVVWEGMVRCGKVRKVWKGVEMCGKVKVWKGRAACLPGYATAYP